MPTTQPIFRVFVSSTFSDFEIEREVLREVWANLQSFCASRGASFQEVDLRWGISPESANSHETLQICIDEIQRCQQLSPKPNFIILMGDRYGWRPVPPSIPDVDYNKIKECAKVDKFNINLLETWYWRDENAIPPNYALKTIKDNPEQWQTDELKLAAFLRESANKLQLDDELYQHSATHREIVRGLLENPEARDHVFCFKRTIINLPEISDGDAKKFSDFIDGSRDADAANLLAVLHDKMEKTLPDAQTYIYKADWHEDTSQISYNHLSSLKSDVESCLTGIIDKQLSEIMQTDPLDTENEAHRNFAMVTSRNLIGREADIKIIDDYITSVYETSPLTPLIVSSPAGYGKSALISKLFLSAPKSNAVVIGRFIGATPCSWLTESFLINMISQIEHSYGQQETQQSGEKTLRELTELFSARLRLASSDKPMILLIDALDQFTGSSSQVITSVIPRELPQHVALVCSVLYDDTSEYLDHIKNLYPNMKHHALAGLTPQNCEDILDSALENYKRKVTIQQKKQLLKNACGSPLYTTLLIQKARRLHHNEEVEDLPSEPTELAEKLVLSLAKRHYELLTIRALGYIKAARFGLSERELLEVLWNDVDVRIEFKEYCKKINQPEPNSALPLIVWSRIYAELETYINEFSMDGELLLRFFHRLFGDVAEELNKDDMSLLHKRLASYFNKQSLYITPDNNIKSSRYPNGRKVMELPWQLLKAGQLKVAEKLVTNFDFAMAKCQLNRSDDWADDLRKLVKIIPDTRVWQEFVRERAHILRRGINEWPAHKILLQLAMEHADDSPLTTGAEKYLAEGRCDWTWMRREHRVQHAGENNCLVEFEGHDNGITCVNISPDGRHVVSGGEDRKLRLWDIETGACLRIFEGHTDTVTCLSVNPDGSQVVSGGLDNTLRIWDVDSGKCVGIKKVHTQVYCVCLSPDGNRLLSAGHDNTLFLWNLEDDRIITEKLDWRVLCISISPNGRHFVSGGLDCNLRLWDLDKFTCLKILKGHSTGVSCVSISLDGKFVVSGSYDTTLRVWDMYTGTCCYTFKGHRLPIYAINISPDGRYVISAGSDSTLRLWDIKTKTCVRTFEGHTKTVKCISISSNGRRAISGGSSSTLRLWNLAAENYQPTTEKHARSVKSVCVSLNGQYVITGCDDNIIRVWETNTGACLRTFKAELLMNNKMSISSDSHHVITACWDNTLRVWNIETGECLSELDDAFPNGFCMYRGANGSLAISGVNDITPYILDLETGHRYVLVGHTGLVTCATISSDGRTAVTGSSDETLRIWDLMTGACLLILKGHTAVIRSVSISQDGCYIVSGSDDKTLRLWNFENDHCLSSYHAKSPVTAAAFLPSMKCVIGTEDGHINFLTAESIPVHCSTVTNGRNWNFCSEGDPDKFI